MSLIATPALVLHAFKYGESSKIVRLLTRDAGVQSAIAKGARGTKSRFGARLQVLSSGTAQLYVKTTRDLQTLGGFDVQVQRPELARDVRRYTAAAAAAELVLRFSPSEPHPEIYDLVVAGLDRLVSVPESELDGAALKLLWTTVGALGFAPRVDACARCGGALAPGAVVFSISDGGLLCHACGAGRRHPRLDPRARRTLLELITDLGEPDRHIGPRYAAAHRRLLVEFVTRHVAEGRDLPALHLWAGLSTYPAAGAGS